MFIKPRTISLTLIATLLTVLVAVEANDFAVPRREHDSLKRFVYKKRADGVADLGNTGIINFAGDPNAGNTNGTTSTNTTSTDTGSNSTVTSTSASGTSLSGSTTTTSSSSSSTTSTTSQTTTTTTSAATGGTTTHVTSTIFNSQTLNDAAATNVPEQQSATAVKKSTITTILIVIGASLGGVAILWTVFRKTKLGGSKKMDERMNPIDWNPSNDNSDAGIVPAHRLARTNSQSSTNYGASAHGHGGYAGDNHDFTAPSANLAPVGGYADLARGSSPQPQMQETLNRGPSVNRSYGAAYDTGVPLHHQAGYGNADAYDYNGDAVRF